MSARNVASPSPSLEENVSDPLSDLSKALDVVLESSTKSLDSIRQCSRLTVEELTAFVDQECDDRLDKEQVRYLKRTLRTLMTEARAAVKEHRENHAFVSRLGKKVHKFLDYDLDSVMPARVTSSMEVFDNAVNVVIMNHLLLNRLDDVAMTFLKECKMELGQPVIEELTKVHRIMRAIHAFDAEPVLEWISRQDFKPEYELLIFKVLKVQFREIALKEGNEAALDFCRAHISQFGNKYPSEIVELISTLAIFKESPLPKGEMSVGDVRFWQELVDTFSDVAAKQLNMPVKTCLLEVIVAGCDAIPSVNGIRQHVQRTNANWMNIYDLPVQCENWHHACFWCPILREIVEENNPPMRLNCGHIISKIAMERLSDTSRIRCPYCPTQLFKSDAKQVYF